ncbi:MAG: hypothetical protein NC311_10830 [Muribaculaceae bacterium]|nr:hypothetical protein [Muribaculaceae bacterium]
MGITQKLLELQRKISSIKSVLSKFGQVPIGAIIQSPIDISGENFKRCDGSTFTLEPTYDKFYAYEYTPTNTVLYIKEDFTNPPSNKIAVKVYQYKDGNMVEYNPELTHYMQTNGVLIASFESSWFTAGRRELKDINIYTYYPDLHVTKVKFYRLCNLTRSTYDDNGNITFRFFHNDLWTTDPNICKRKNPDLRNLYRQLRYRGKDNYSIAQNLYDKISRCFINIQEEITMSNGAITSESSFYDGKYRVELSEYVEKEVVEGNGLYYYNNYDFKDIKCISTTKISPHSSGGGYYIEGAQHKEPKYYVYSAAATDHTISDNGWLTSMVDGKHLTFSETPCEDGVTGTTATVTHKVADNYCYIKFDFITPPTFVASRDIFYAYRAFILRVSAATGALNIYIAGYNSSGLKWRVSNKATGFTLLPNRKYKLLYYCTGVSGSYTHRLSLKLLHENEDYYTNVSTSEGEYSYSVTSNYFPYNYYNSYGIRTMYHADASAWTEGQFIDLLSLRIQHTGDTAFTNFNNEFRAAKLSYQSPSDNGLALPRITGNDGGEYYIRVK